VKNRFAYWGYILALIGGILIIVFGLLSLIGNSLGSAFSPAGYYLTGAMYSIVAIIIGVICIVGSKSVGTLVWAIVLLVLGIVSGGLGGALVILGALLGLVSIFVKS
jgi:phosphate starvation-inducible membrane PsiE